MGKSLENAIFLVDNEETAKSKIMGVVTDQNKIKKDDPANPEICMVYYYHQLVNNEENLNTICSECKKELIEKMNYFLKPIRGKA